MAYPFGSPTVSWGFAAALPPPLAGAAGFADAATLAAAGFADAATLAAAGFADAAPLAAGALPAGAAAPPHPTSTMAASAEPKDRSFISPSVGRWAGRPRGRQPSPES